MNFVMSPRTSVRQHANLLSAAIRTLACMLVLVGLAIPPALHAQYCTSTIQNSKLKPALQGLPEVEQARISAALGADQDNFYASPLPDGFRFFPSSAALSATFDGRGATFQTAGGAWGVTAARIGYGKQLATLNSSAPQASANHVSYDRGGVTEWYANGPLGIEQGFTIASAPGKSSGAPLTLELAVSGDFVPSLDSDSRTASLAKNGMPVLTYGRLTATDARGQELHAWLELKDKQLSVLVDDAHAQYPVTIDPYVLLVTMQACDGTQGDFYASAAALSRDGSTVAVLSATGTYVFQKGIGILGWNALGTNQAIAKLIPSDYISDVYIGQYLGDVAVSSDGSTIVMGSFGNQAVYVFTKPSGGWSSTTALAETAKLTPSDSTSWFGYSVAISNDGNTIIAGNPEIGIGYGLGRAYLFAKKASDTWSNGNEYAQLTPSDNRDEVRFGAAVAISGDSDTVVVGGPNSDLPEVPDPLQAPGHIYIFQYPSGGWQSTTQTAELWASDGFVGDHLGRSVAVNEDGTVVAASSAAGAYVFLKPPLAWAEQLETIKLVASNPTTLADYGSLAMSDDGSRIFLGALRFSNLGWPGSVYAFLEPAWGWAPTFDSDGNPIGFSPMSETGQISAGFDHEFGFRPVATSSDGATLIGANPDKQSVFLLTGDMTFPHASVYPSIFFGNQTVGTSATKGLTIYNTGNAPLHVSSDFNSDFADGGPFTNTIKCLGNPIAPGSSCTEWVTFLPNVLGDLTANVSVMDDSGGFPLSTQLVNLYGTGIIGSTTTSLTGVVPNPALVGQQATAGFAVSGPGGDALTPTGTVTVSASPAGTHCVATLPAGSCMLPAFTSPVTQTITATYSGDANFQGSTSSPATEKVVDYKLSATPTTQTVSSGHNAVYSLTLSGYNGFSGVIGLSCKGGPAKSACTVSPTSINLTGASATAKATLSTLQGVTKGVYQITFTASYGTTTRTATSTLTIK